jgi:hypothetical protein
MREGKRGRNSETERGGDRESERKRNIKIKRPSSIQNQVRMTGNECRAIKAAGEQRLTRKWPDFDAIVKLKSTFAMFLFVSATSAIALLVFSNGLLPPVGAGVNDFQGTVYNT